MEQSLTEMAYKEAHLGGYTAFLGKDEDDDVEENDIDDLSVSDPEDDGDEGDLEEDEKDALEKKKEDALDEMLKDADEVLIKSISKYIWFPKTKKGTLVLRVSDEGYVE